jgi:hypothetical protein
MWIRARTRRTRTAAPRRSPSGGDEPTGVCSGSSADGPIHCAPWLSSLSPSQPIPGAVQPETALVPSSSGFPDSKEAPSAREEQEAQLCVMAEPVAEAMADYCFLGRSLSSQWRWWELNVTEPADGHGEWVCSVDASQRFTTRWPGSWSPYRDSATWQLYWYNEDTGEWFFTTERRSPQSLAPQGDRTDGEDMST